MKKLIAMLLVVAMSVSLLVGCGAAEPGSTTPPTTTEAAKAPLTGTMEEIAGKIIEKKPVEFMGGCMPIDLKDTSEDGLWAISHNTGLKSAEGLTDLAVYEPMMGSIAFSMVLVRVSDAANAKTVAESMKSGIDTRKWICVEANDLQVVGYCDTVMLIMVDSNTGMKSQDFVDAFKAVCGADLDFII